MKTPVILVDRPADLPVSSAGLTVLATRDYIADPGRVGPGPVRLINLSRDMVYLGLGYYASLLAEARGHAVIPSAVTIVGMKDRGRAWTAIRDVERVLLDTLRRLKDPPTASFSIDVHFGHTDDARFARVARQAFDRLRTPIQRIQVRLDPTWGPYVKAIRPRTLADLGPAELERFAAALEAHTRRAWRDPALGRPIAYRLAVLVDSREAFPPSDAKALERLERAGERLGVSVERIGVRDYARLAEFDALFIRMTTAIDNPSFRFARKAADEGMPVIDDPRSILRCTNKVYLAETLAAQGIATPKTVVLDQTRLARAADILGFPMVLKVPDGSFSRGVVKVESPAELRRVARKLFADSDLILAQEFMPTEFDWRVGVLDGAPLFVVKYHMAPSHWQIYRHGDDGRVTTGGWTTLPIEDAPPEVIAPALAAARLMGDGLYGVDLKQNAEGVFVIEVNDNPSLESGVEDKVSKDRLYRTLLESFVRRIETRPPPISNGTRPGLR
ncbi:RimK family protein [Roseospirillum parvum]|uniref:Glutathione synthase/RimK-type ligase, ATP-grasp superfamily n=1 Tax=Roseospirillum parvum TaxID=83401 RepID=A0A1G7URA4_9PROT|nr:RimK family protein [Roseospirillum parvum]SDG50082.1 Glutathione synthase/RimK-type ligase, ATP-grasp superfamily [Roseospirillum parvum]